MNSENTFVVVLSVVSLIIVVLIVLLAPQTELEVPPEPLRYIGQVRSVDYGDWRTGITIIGTDSGKVIIAGLRNINYGDSIFTRVLPDGFREYRIGNTHAYGGER